MMARGHTSDDRRVVLLKLTQKGRALTREIHQQVQAY